MTLKYAAFTFSQVFHAKMYKYEALCITVLTLCSIFGPICHLTYASQYMKTCYLTPGIVKKALLLLERHRTVIENEYE